jgi:hypothetical protein
MLTSGPILWSMRRLRVWLISRLGSWLRSE